MLHFVEGIFETIVQYGILFMELVGVVVLLVTALQSLYTWGVKHQRAHLKLAQGIALALEFKLGSEILKTVIVRDWTEIATVAGIIALRAALTFLIHWEIKEENKDMQEQEERQKAELSAEKEE